MVQRQLELQGGDNIGPVCFRVRFDAVVPTAACSFRGPHKFESPSEIVIHFKIPLKSATLDDFSTYFLQYVARRFPRLPQECEVEAFFINAESAVLFGTEPPVELGPFLRLDTHVNANDTLDNFFIPYSPADGAGYDRPVGYDVIAHWRPKSSNYAGMHGTSEKVSEHQSQPLQSAAADASTTPALHLDATTSSPLLVATTPSPLRSHALDTSSPPCVIFPFSQRCVYTRLPSHAPASLPVEEAEASSGSISARIAATASAVSRRTADRLARVALESAEKLSRDRVAEDEHDARYTLSAIEYDERRQAVLLLCLADVKTPMCGIELPVLLQSRPAKCAIDTEPLAGPPNTSFYAELADCVEHTTHLSHRFAARQGAVAPKPAVAPTQSPLEAELEDCVEHYAEGRRDILSWERQTFRALTTEMRRILEKQQKMEEEEKLLHTAILEEIARADVLGFNCYTTHYMCGAAFAAESKPLAADKATIPHEAENRTSTEGTNGILFNKNNMGVNAEMDDAMRNIIACAESGRLSPRSYLADDENFRKAVAESKARAVAALETIRNIDMRYYEPVSIRMAKHRLAEAECVSRNAILATEADEAMGLQEHAQNEGLDRLTRELRTKVKFFAPAVEEEAHIRSVLMEMEDRRMVLYLSLYKRGAERLEARLRKEADQRDAAATDE